MQHSPYGATYGLQFAHPLMQKDVPTAPPTPPTSSETDPLLFQNIFPGPELMSYYSVQEKLSGPVCDRLVTANEKEPQVCIGDFSQMSARKHVAKRHPLQCLKDKLLGPGGIYSKACQLCSARELDGIMWANSERLGRPCTDRYRALNRMALHINALDPVIRVHLHKATIFIDNNFKSGKSLDEALEHDREDLKSTKGADIFMDVDNDGGITDEEIKSYLKAVYIVADVVRESIGGNHTNGELVSWTTPEMHQWLEFNQGFSSSR